jgi:ABC-2 type transport system ATP-binding protein
MASSELITIHGVSHRYPGADRNALEHIDLTIARGITFGLLGPNGAGKSTLLSILTGIAPIQSGEITIAGLDLRSQARVIKARSALVPQEYAFYLRLTGRENLRFFAGAYGLTRTQYQHRLEECIEICGLQEVIDRRAKHYSGGLKRRLNLAIGLISRPEVLYLDEPTVGIDAHSRECILQAIRALQAAGTTIIYTSHYMEEIELLCDEVAIIDHGRILIRESVDRLLRADANETLQLSFDTAPTAAARAALARWNPIFVDEVHVQLTAKAHDLPAILRELFDNDSPVVQLTYGVSRLHDVYLTLLKEGA